MLQLSARRLCVSQFSANTSCWMSRLIMYHMYHELQMIMIDIVIRHDYQWCTVIHNDIQCSIQTIVKNTSAELAMKQKEITRVSGSTLATRGNAHGWVLGLVRSQGDHRDQDIVMLEWETLTLQDAWREILRHLRQTRLRNFNPLRFAWHFCCSQVPLGNHILWTLVPACFCVLLHASLR